MASRSAAYGADYCNRSMHAVRHILAGARRRWRVRAPNQPPRTIDIGVTSAGQGQGHASSMRRDVHALHVLAGVAVDEKERSNH